MAITRAEIERRRQEAAHARATGQAPKAVRRRCLIAGCPDGGAWSECPDQQAANAEQKRHYLEHHYVRTR